MSFMTQLTDAKYQQFTMASASNCRIITNYGITNNFDDKFENQNMISKNIDSIFEDLKLHKVNMNFVNGEFILTIDNKPIDKIKLKS